MKTLSPKEFFRRGSDVPALLLASAVCFGWALTLPVITVKRLVFWTDTFSIWLGIKTLYKEGYPWLATLVFMFTIVFPVMKLAAMFGLWIGELSGKSGKRILEWVGHLGKWSMMDVFIVALTIVLTRVSRTMEAHARPGIYVFAVSILLAMLAWHRLKYCMRSPRQTK